MKNNSSRLYFKRHYKNIIAKIFAYIMAFFCFFFLTWILSSLVYNGLAHFNLDLFTKITPPPGGNGGLLNAMVGSFLMVGFAVVLGTPIAILVAVYLSEYGHGRVYSSIVRFTTNLLLSAPSIILGLFVYELYVVRHGGFSGWAGTLALMLIVIPVIIRTSDNVLGLVPGALKEAAEALGSPKWKLLLFIVYPIVKSGIVTGAVLAFARISGETAPLLFTALNNQFLNLDLDKPMASLPVVIFPYAMSSYEDWHELAWSGALLLAMVVLVLNVMIRIIFRQKIPVQQ